MSECVCECVCVYVHVWCVSECVCVHVWCVSECVCVCVCMCVRALAGEGWTPILSGKLQFVFPCICVLQVDM